MLFRLLITLLRVVGAEQLAYPVRQLSRGSLRTLLSRTLRLRRLAAAMAAADPVPPLPIRLQIETTDICNMKCVMCTREVLDGMNTTTMSLDQFTKIVGEIEPFYATLNGLGEQLIDSTIFEKLDFLHTRGIVTAMPTNGTYIRGERLEKLAAKLPDTVTFSIDGTTKSSYEQIRVLGNFDQSIRNYRDLLQLRRDGKTRPNTRIQILVVLMKANLYDFRHMCDLRNSLPGIDSLHIVPFFDYDAEGNAFSHLVPTPDEVKAMLPELDGAIKATPNEADKEFYQCWRAAAEEWLVPVRGGVFSKDACLVPWYSTYIDAKGTVYPCCYLTNSEHVMGNINHSGLREIWRSPAYQTFRGRLATARQYLPGCRTCPKNDNGPLGQLQRFKALL